MADQKARRELTEVLSELRVRDLEPDYRRSLVLRARYLRALLGWSRSAPTGLCLL